MFAEWVDALVKTKPPLLVVDGTMLRPPGAPILPDSDQAALSKVAPFQHIIDREYVEARVFAHKDIETKLTFLVRKDVVSPSEISKGR
jgi:hypothetical protein